MRKEIKHLCLGIGIMAFACSTPLQQSPTLVQVREKYPHSVLGEDFGLLTEEDVATSSCVARASPFSTQNLSAHPYWQCFALKDSSFECEEADSNEEGRTAILAIVLKKDGILNDYLSRRAIPMDSCEAYRADWVRLTSGQSQICISGEFIDEKTEKKYRSWIFESYKTRNGCDSYFQGGCSLTYKIQHGCNLAEMTGYELKNEDNKNHPR